MRLNDVNDTIMQIPIIPLAKRLDLSIGNLEQTAAVHRYRGDQAVSPTIRRQNNTADEYLQYESHLVNRRVLDYEENVIAQIRQWYLSGIVLLDDPFRYQGQNDVIGQSACITKAQIYDCEESADFRSVHHYQPILFAFHVSVLYLHLHQAKSDLLSVNYNRPKFNDRQKAENLCGNHFHVFGQIFAIEVSVNHVW